MIHKIQQDLVYTANKLKISKLDDYEKLKMNENSRSTNFFQMVSNSVLIVILMVVLLFMVFVACFLLVTMFKRNTVVKKPNKQKDNQTYDRNVHNFFRNPFKLTNTMKDNNLKETHVPANLMVISFIALILYTGTLIVLNVHIIFKFFFFKKNYYSKLNNVLDVS